MQRVESEPAMTALFADHRAAVSTFAPSSLSSSSAPASVLPVIFVSMISLSAFVLLRTLALSSLVLTGPAGSRVRGGAGLAPIDTGETLGG
ncbi:MAG TPA: hypothetical protein VH599_08915 [Ktedonobacterales bacterium]|jgi:hypothetical protein